jgi:orotate phosphoribosyltransferase
MEDLIKRLKEIGIVEKKEVRLKNGENSDLYFDLKKAYGIPDALQLIAIRMLERIPQEVNCIAVNGHGGIPLGAAISLIGDKRLSMIRDEEKKYGTRKLIDGYHPNRKDNVMVLDDVLTTGGSLRKMRYVVKETGANVIGNLVVINRSLQKRRPKNENGYDYLIEGNELV